MTSELQFTTKSWLIFKRERRNSKQFSNSYHRLQKQEKNGYLQNFGTKEEESEIKSSLQIRMIDWKNGKNLKAWSGERGSQKEDWETERGESLQVQRLQFSSLRLGSLFLRAQNHTISVTQHSITSTTTRTRNCLRVHIYHTFLRS